MLECAFCNSEIESDSWYCDQCGKEILLCETCNKPGRGQWCEEDGGSLVAAKNANALPEAPAPAQPANSTASTAVTTANATTGTSVPDTAQTVSAPELKLVNAQLGITLDIQPDSILGRTTGPYVQRIGSLTAVSGKHLLFKYHPVKGWSFTDLGSSNGTKYSKTNTAWQQTNKVPVNEDITLENGAFLLVANVEFAVQIAGNAPGTTERI